MGAALLEGLMAMLEGVVVGGRMFTIIFQLVHFPARLQAWWAWAGRGGRVALQGLVVWAD